MNALLIISLMLAILNLFLLPLGTAPPLALRVGMVAVVAGMTLRILAGAILDAPTASVQFFAGGPLLVALPALLLSAWQLQLRRHTVRHSG